MYGTKTINNPAIPWVESFERPLESRDEIVVEGVSYAGSKSFAINLAVGPILEGSCRSDIVFHFNPRYDQRYVARNTFEQGQWAKEEGSGTFPFMAEKAFVVTIRIKDVCFDVEVDGNLFISYGHRIPVDKIKTLQITGDLVLSRVQIPSLQIRPNIVQQPCYPRVFPSCPTPGLLSYNAKVPFDHMLPNKLRVGKSIILSGQVLPYGNRFSTELISEDLPIPGESVNLKFQVNLARTNSVTRNSKICGNWGRDEIAIPSFPFSRRVSFEITFRCEEDRLVILVNNVFFCNYNHRLPYHAINKVRVDGDVQINCVAFT